MLERNSREFIDCLNFADGDTITWKDIMSSFVNFSAVSFPPPILGILFLNFLQIHKNIKNLFLIAGMMCFYVFCHINLFCIG